MKRCATRTAPPILLLAQLCMTLSRLTLAASIVAASITTWLGVAHATTTSMSTVWKYDEPVIIRGDNLDGDEPEYKKLCISPEGSKDDKECY